MVDMPRGVYKRNPEDFKRGTDHPNWKGEGVSYKSNHRWVRRNKPIPLQCEECHVISKDLDAANISGEYKRDINDYKYLCIRCHRKFDGWSTSDNFKYSRLGKINNEKQKEASRNAQLKRWTLWRQNKLGDK